MYCCTPGVPGDGCLCRWLGGQLVGLTFTILNAFKIKTSFSAAGQFPHNFVKTMETTQQAMYNGNNRNSLSYVVEWKLHQKVTLVETAKNDGGC